MLAEESLGRDIFNFENVLREEKKYRISRIFVPWVLDAFVMVDDRKRFPVWSVTVIELMKGDAQGY